MVSLARVHLRREPSIREQATLSQRRGQSPEGSRTETPFMTGLRSSQMPKHSEDIRAQRRNGPKQPNDMGGVRSDLWICWTQTDINRDITESNSLLQGF